MSTGTIILSFKFIVFTLSVCMDLQIFSYRIFSTGEKWAAQVPMI